MNPLLQQVDDLLTAKDKQIAAGKPVYVFPALQAAAWEMQWGVGRSRPVITDDHGKAAFYPGNPAQLYFSPKTLTSGDSDNLYMLCRLAQYLPAGALASVTKVTYSLQVGISDLSVCQAFEFEWQKNSGLKIWNGGLQFLPGNPWIVRAFDFMKGDWKPLGISIDPALLAPGKLLDVSAEFTLSDTGVTYGNLKLNGSSFAMNFNQAIGNAKVASEQFNVAVQPDALTLAKPYVITLGNVTLTLSSGV